MESEKSDSKTPQDASRPARIYYLKPFVESARPGAMPAGPGRSGAPAPPASALIHQKSNSGVEIQTPQQNKAEKVQTGTATKVLPGRLRKKGFSIQDRIQWMVDEYGPEHIGFQTLTVQENLTDRREFNRRFKSLARNVFPRLYEDWLRVYERQKRGAWHVHLVVALKADIRTGTDVEALDRLLKAKKDGKISKAAYYASIQRLTSENLRGLWKEYRRLCGLGEFKQRRKSKGKRYYKFDASHLLPVISTPQALAAYVAKYISKGFENRRTEDKGMRLVGCSKRVAHVCSERFSWADGAGKVWRAKLGVLAEMLNFKSSDDFAKALGCRWAYHIRPAIDLLMLSHYATMREARADGWDLVNKADGSPWPWPDLDSPKAQVQASRMEAFKVVTGLIQRRRGKPKWKSRAEMAWDPERWEGQQDRPREFKVFKPPPKPRVMCQDEFSALEPPRTMKD
jgi:hypothetical protein